MKKSEKQIKEEQAKQRQINYYIMRHLWQVIRGRGSKDIYTTLGINRTRYTKALDGESVKFSKKALEGLGKDTGLPQEVFTGEKGFGLKGKTFEILFDNYTALKRKHCNNRMTGAYKGEDKLVKENKQNILEKLNKAQKDLDEELDKKWEEIAYSVTQKKDDNTDSLFYKLCFYIRWEETIALAEPADAINYRIKYLEKVIALQNLNGCSLEELESIATSIAELYKRVMTVHDYKILTKDIGE